MLYKLMLTKGELDLLLEGMHRLKMHYRNEEYESGIELAQRMEDMIADEYEAQNRLYAVETRL